MQLNKAARDDLPLIDAYYDNLKSMYRPTGARRLPMTLLNERPKRDACQITGWPA